MTVDEAFSALLCELRAWVDHQDSVMCGATHEDKMAEQVLVAFRQFREAAIDEAIKFILEGRP